VRGLLNARCYQFGAKIAVFVSVAQGLNTPDLPNETLQVPAVNCPVLDVLLRFSNRRVELWCQTPISSFISLHYSISRC
jgi:hypothetical protein